MKLLSLQLALFTSDLISRPDLMLATVNEKMGNIFDAMPTILNVPNDVPVEFPVAQGRSGNGNYALNVSRARVDFIINFGGETLEDERPSTLLKQSKPLIDKMSKAVFGAQRVNRVGLIVSLIETTDANVKRIYEKHLREEYTPKCNEVAIRTNNQILDKGFIYNNICVIESATANASGKQSPVIHIQFDINNVPRENGEPISQMEVSNVFSKCSVLLRDNSLKEMV